MTRIALRMASLTVVMFCLVGCERSTAPIEATVSLDGQPFPVGTLVITSDDGLYSDNAQILQGKAIISKAPVGRVKVAVLPQRVSPDSTAQPQTDQPDPISPPNLAELARMIPAYYKDPNRSGLVFEIVEGGNTIDIALFSQTTPPRP